MTKLSWKNWSLAVKLTIAMTTLVIMTVIGISMLFILREQRSFRRELEQQSLLMLNNLSVSETERLYFLDAEFLSNLARKLCANQTVVLVRFYDPEGRVIADAHDQELTQHLEADPFGLQLVTSQVVVLEWQANRLVAGQAVTVEDQLLGAISVGLSTGLLKAKIAAVRNQGLSIALLAGIAGILLALQISRSVTKPLRPLMEATNHIADGDLRGAMIELSGGAWTEKKQGQTILSQRYELLEKDHRGNNEIIVLSRSFYTMASYLQEMSTIADNISQGEMMQTIIPRSERDMLGQAFRRMSEYLREIASAAAVIADGDLTGTVHVRSSADTFGRVIQSMLESLRSLNIQIRDSAEQIASTGTTIASLAAHDIGIVRNVNDSMKHVVLTMNETSTSVEEVAHNMETFSASVEETSVSISQMASTVTNIASNTTSLQNQTQQTVGSLNEAVRSLEAVVKSTDISQELSQETIQDALEGQQAVEQVATSMDTIQQTVTVAVDTITRFEQRSQEIDTILEVIRQITEQTSLLALNASIIAAQAGAHGRGFAVVADEIKGLANGVNASTKDIASIVHMLQQETMQVVQTIYTGDQNVKQGLEHARQAREKLQKILGSAQRSSSVVSEIAEALHDLMTTTRTVSLSMEQVNMMTDEITTATIEHQAGTKQIQQAITQFTNMASQIQQATTQQSTGVQQVLKAAHNVESLIDQNLKSAQKTSQTTEILASQSDLLLRLVDQFKLTK